jgi:hypothetical protein
MNYDPDQMTYEELLELQEKIGFVCKGFTKEEIQLIPIIKFNKLNNDNSNAEEKCTICQFEYLKNEELRQLTCNHCFHPACVDEWLKKEKCCPNCKKEVILRESEIK